MSRLGSGWNMPPGCYRTPYDEPDPPDWHIYKQGIVKKGRKCTNPNCPMGGMIPPGHHFQQWVSREGGHVTMTQTCVDTEFGPPCSVKYKPCPDGHYDHHWSYCQDPEGQKDQQGYPATCKTCGGKGYVERTNWKIMKASRNPDGPPYAGSTCQHAGVEPGKVYTNKAEAEADAKKLSDHNPVGFRVVPIEWPPTGGDR